MAEGSLSTKPVLKNSIVTGTPNNKDKKIKKILKKEKKNSGFSSLIKINNTFKILNPSLKVFNLLCEPFGLDLYLQLISSIGNRCSNA